MRRAGNGSLTPPIGRAVGEFTKDERERGQLVRDRSRKRHAEKRLRNCKRPECYNLVVSPRQLCYGCLMKKSVIRMGHNTVPGDDGAFHLNRHRRVTFAAIQDAPYGQVDKVIKKILSGSLLLYG